MSLDAHLEETRRLVDEALDRWLPPSTAAPKRLHEAMRYAIFAGGKRLRPALARAACRSAGGRDAAVLPAACALELLHTYSLIHDDLPALDDDDLRRGKPTCHRRFDERTAILAGDALQTQAFWILATRAPAAAARDLVRELADAAGTGGMVGGEIADLEAEGAPPERAVVEFIHGRKTAALFRASAVMGGISAGAPPGLLDAYRDYGLALGMSFQIVDDILDETSDPVTLGKSTGKDRAQRKMTYPAAAGLEESRARAREFAEAAKQALHRVPDPSLLAALADFAVDRIQ